MEKTMLTFWSFFVFILATASALECYEQVQMKCGDHDPIYDDFCETLASSMAEDPVKTTCPNQCGTLEVTQAHQANFEINLLMLACMPKSDGCLDKEQLEAESPEVSQQLKAFESAGVTTTKLLACTCGNNLCNGAVNLAGRSAYFLIIIAFLKVILLD